MALTNARGWQMMKKYVIIICGVMLIAVIAIIAGQIIFQNSENATDMEYRTEM